MLIEDFFASINHNRLACPAGFDSFPTSQNNLQLITNQFLLFADEVVAQFKSTLLLLPNGTVLATGIPVDLNLYESEYSVTDEELVKILAESPNLVTGGGSSSSKNKKKKKKPAAGGEGANKENATEETATENKA